MYSFINSTTHQILLELRKGRKECEWLGHVEWMLHDTCTGLSEIHNHNEELTPLLGACMYMYTKLQTNWHIHCCHRCLNSLYESLPNSQWSNTIDISTAFMLGFWLCQLYTSIFSLGLWLSSSTKFSLWLFEFNICNLG